MKITKKDGILREFDIEKVSVALVNSAKKVESEISDSDLKLILKQVEKRIQTLNGIARVTSTYEVRGVVYQVLKDNGFTELSRAYMGL